MEKVDRLWSRIDKDGPVHHRLGTKCWLWTGRIVDGYGKIQRNRKILSVHRVVWEIFYGPIPPGTGPHGTVVRHKCDVRNCCNIEHLEIGTQAENVTDMMQRGRHGWVAHRNKAARGVKHYATQLSDEQVKAIRSRYERREAKQVELATEYRITQSMVSLIVHRKNWKHVD